MSEILTKSGKTWQYAARLRFILRDGERVLQQLHRCLETCEMEWRDVPVEGSHES